MITANQPKTIGVVFKNGVTAYVYETQEREWGIRFCDRPWRGSIVKELPQPLRGMYPSEQSAIQAIADHYRTGVRLIDVTPRL